MQIIAIVILSIHIIIKRLSSHYWTGLRSPDTKETRSFVSRLPGLPLPHTVFPGHIQSPWRKQVGEIST